MGWRGKPSSEPRCSARAGERPSPFARVALSIPRQRRATGPYAAWLVAAALLAPTVALAHERWVPHTPRFPVNRAFFQAMRGEVLVYSAGATLAVFGVIVLWYLSAPGIVEALTPATPAARAREARRGPVGRFARGAVRFALDGDTDSPFMRRGLAVMTFVFGRIPALVLALGVYQGWLVMPSFPLPHGTYGTVVRVVEAALAVWVATGLFVRPLGAVFFVVFVYLCAAYGIAGVDAIPVLASAFFYLFATQNVAVNARQLLGIRVSLGLGFFLLGLVNKIYLGPELFIGVGDSAPELLIGPQTMFPGFTREAWAFTTALGEMTFGLLLLIGAFSRLTTLVLSFVFSNFMLVFGLAEVVHVYPIAGFLLLFFRGNEGTSLDGIVFRANVAFWRWLRGTPYRLVYGGAVGSVATAVAALMMFVPLLLITDVVPVLAGTEVPRNYRPPPLPPPAAEWPPLKAHADHEAHHGGVVTMTGDAHVEIVVRKDGSILLFASDAVRKPIPPREVTGKMEVDRQRQRRVTVPLQAEASGAVAGMGPPPPGDYTYVLQIRGTPATQTLHVPAEGTDGLVKRGGGPG